MLNGKWLANRCADIFCLLEAKNAANVGHWLAFSKNQAKKTKQKMKNLSHLSVTTCH
jgi:hypothetical protein